MSTRGAIVRLKNGRGTQFEGRYHHWDSYPSGLGATLWTLYHGHLQKDLKRMLEVLIDEHPAGWSTIVNADWSFDPGFRRTHDNERRCTVCGRANWEHYRQYYGKDGRPAEPDFPPVETGNYLLTDHSPQEEVFPEDSRPECNCHGDRAEEGWVVDQDNAGGSGVEYVYAFDEGPTMVVLSSYRPSTGAKMVGMFGMGDPDSVWVEIARIPLEGEEPNWETIKDE